MLDGSRLVGQADSSVTALCSRQPDHLPSPADAIVGGACEKRLFGTTLYQKRSFYQDRLRTNIGKALKKRGVTFAGASLGAFLEAYGCEATPSPARLDPAAALKISRYQLGKKTPFLRHFIGKMITLPRQARDKHRES